MKKKIYKILRLHNGPRDVAREHSPYREESLYGSPNYIDCFGHMLFVCWEAVESNHVTLETIRTVILTPTVSLRWHTCVDVASSRLQSWRTLDRVVCVTVLCCDFVCRVPAKSWLNSITLNWTHSIQWSLSLNALRVVIPR